MKADTRFEIIAFRLGDQLFCVPTTSVREIRGWAKATPVPHSPHDVMGVMNLRGRIIPIIDLAVRLGMRRTEPTERSAIVVAEVGDEPLGLVVDTVSDMLTVATNELQPIPDIGDMDGAAYSDGVISHATGMVCFLNLDRLFPGSANPKAA